MANIRKSFNFRNGVQVDNDNFVVNANGLVGIGTSAPSLYKLNVYGDTRTTGLTTTRDLYAQNIEISGITTVGVLTASSIDIANGLNVSGILTAQLLRLANGDTVDNLIGFARTTFIDDGVGIHTTSKVGIGTTTANANYQLDILGDTRVTGIISATTFTGDLTGNINASSGVSTFTELKVGTAITMSAGIITATTFTGDLTGTVTGTATTATNLSDGANITTGTISDARLPDLITSNINTSSGVSTFTELKVGTAITMSAGIVTATTFIGNLTGNVNASSGVSTFTELKVGTAITMSAGIVTATTFEGALNSTNLTGTINNDRLPVTPQFTSIGIGTTSPTDALHIQQSGAAEIYVGSDTDASSLRVGRNLNDNDSGMVKYGNTSGVYPYSTENSLDFMNFGQGNVNFYIEAGITTTSDFNFNWNKGGNTNLMTLTKGGNLGIGITNPIHKLNVQGISTFTGNAHFDQDVTIDGALSAESLTLTQSLTANVTGDLIGNVTGNLSGDVAGSLSGISTFNFLDSTRVGIGTTTPRCALDIKDSTDAESGFVLLPSQTTANRPGAGSTMEGSLIYNNTIKRFEFWNGSAWVGLTTEA